VARNRGQLARSGRGTCTLHGGHVKGTVNVEARATLHAYEVRVAGKVQAENARLVLIYPVTSHRWERAGKARRFSDATSQYR
jgi:hypothetical protein